MKEKRNKKQSAVSLSRLASLVGSQGTFDMIFVKLILMLCCLGDITGKFAIDSQGKGKCSVIVSEASANRIRQLYSGCLTC